MQWSLALAPCLLQQSLASAPQFPPSPYLSSMKVHYSHKHLESSQWTCQHILENTICVENVLVSHWRLVVKKKKAKPWTKYAIPLQNPNNLWFGTTAIGNLFSLCSEERRIQKEQKDSRLEFLFTTDFIGVDMKIVFCPGWCDGVSPLGTKWGRNNCEHSIIVGLNFGQDGCWDRR